MPQGQNELFPLEEVARPKNCRQCAHFTENPYWRCRLHNGALLRSLAPCDKLQFAFPGNNIPERTRPGNYKVKECL